ncbi:MAG TPA: hypothetical protein VGB53_00260, partial [Rubricoccaceae bacterium]
RFSIQANTFTRGSNNAVSNSINVNQAGLTPASGVMEGRINNNTIGDASSSTSGSSGGYGVGVVSVGSGTTTVKVDNNNIRGTMGGVLIQMGEDTNPAHTMNATVNNNTINISDQNAFNGVYVNIGTTSTNGGAGPDQGVGRLDLSANGVTVTGAATGNGIAVNTRFATGIQLPGYGGGPKDFTAVQAYLQGRGNTSAGPIPFFVSANTASSGYTTTGSVPQPNLPSLVEAEPPSASTADAATEGTSAMTAGIVPAQLGSSERATPGVTVMAPSNSTEPSLVTTPATSEAETKVGDDVGLPEPVLLASADGTESARIAAAASSAAEAPVPAKTSSETEPALRAGETVTATVGTLPAGKTVTVLYDATLAAPFPVGYGVTAQGTVTGSNVPNVPLATFMPVVQSATPARTFAGTPAPGDDAGWRLLAAPVGGVTIAALAAQNLVQGISDFYPAYEPNLYVGYNGTAFVPPAAGSAVLASGNGFFWHFYDRVITPQGGPSQSVQLPFTLSATGTATSGPVTIPLRPNSYNLLGNPFTMT